MIGLRALLQVSLIAAVITFAALLPAVAQPGTVTRVSVSTYGQEGNGNSSTPVISANGRLVAFRSEASNLVPGDTNGVADIFVHDCATNVTEIVSVSTSGELGNDRCFSPAISYDGRIVAYYSFASNLVPNDTNGKRDVFIHDRLTGITDRVSVSSDGTEGNSDSVNPALSGDGRFVAFNSDASNLVPGDTNGKADVFVRDRQNGTTELVSLTDTNELANGASGLPAMSADGRYVAFNSFATNMIHGSTYGGSQIFVRDRVAGTTQMETWSYLSYPEAGFGLSAYPQMTPSARYVVFSSDAFNLVPNDSVALGEVYVRDMEEGITQILSTAPDGGIPTDGGSSSPSISWNAQYVAFSSGSKCVVTDDTNRATDIFFRDLPNATTTRISVAPDGTQGNAVSLTPSVSADGHCVAFDSYSTNLVPNDTNLKDDVFVVQTYVAPSTIEGAISFEGLSGNATPPSTVDVEVRWLGWTMGAWPVAVGPDGSFSAQVAPWIVDVSIKPTHWLRRTLTLDATSGHVSGAMFDLINGDADGNNRVGLGDLSWVLANWGGGDAMADLDGNGAVGFGDLSIVLANYNLTGDP